MSIRNDFCRFRTVGTARALQSAGAPSSGTPAREIPHSAHAGAAEARPRSTDGHSSVERGERTPVHGAAVAPGNLTLATRLELDSEIGLSSATVAAVRGAERGTRGNCSGHIGLISVFVDAGSNVAGEAKIPSNPPVRRVVRHLISSRPGYPRGGVSTPRAVPVRDR